MFDSNLLAIPHVVVGALLILLGAAVVARERANLVSLLFCTMVLIGALWQLSTTRLILSADPSAALAWARIDKAAVAFLPTLVTLFTLTMVQKLRSYRMLAWCAGMSSLLFTSLAVGTNLFVGGVHHYRWGYYAQYGPLSAPFLAFFFGLMLFNLRLYWVEYRRANSQITRSRLRCLLFAFAIAYLASVDYLPGFGVPLYPIGYLPVFVFTVMVALTIWRYRLVDITAAFAARQILRTMADALWVIDQEGIIRVVNQSACQLLGAPEETLVGQPVWGVSSQLLPGDRFHTILRARVIQSYITDLQRPGGRWICLEINASCLRDDQGEPVGVVCIARPASASAYRKAV